MKRILILTLLIITAVTMLSPETYAAETPLMSKKDQLQYMTDLAKNIRRNLWVNGYEDVDTYVEHASKDLLDQHVSESSDHESPLYKDEISKLYRCHYSKTCELYLISSSASIYGGYGSEAHFILLYTKSQKHFEIRHVVYSE